MSDPAFISIDDICNVWIAMPELVRWVCVIVVSVLSGFGLGAWEAGRRMSLQQYAELLRWKQEYLHIALKREEAVSDALAHRILTAPAEPVCTAQTEAPALTEAQRQADEHLRKVIPNYDASTVNDPGPTIAPIIIPAFPPEYSEETIAAMAALSDALKKETQKQIAGAPIRNAKGQFLPRLK